MAQGSSSPLLAVRVRGPLAVFTDPAFKVERVTVPVMTPTAARGLLSAILWKPAIAWHIERIKVLSSIKFTSFRRNEVNSKAPSPTAAIVRDGGTPPVLFADEDRAQRNTVALRDVDYVIETRFSLTDRAGASDNVPKFVDMFRRRVEKGQHFMAPYFGCREFAADVMPAEGAPPPIADSRKLGRILWDIEYGVAGRTMAHFFDAELIDGVLNVPARIPDASGVAA
ncbi:MAG: type I-C CRISPR-associated protein Cas5c [Gemmatimonadaceae bacterium]